MKNNKAGVQLARWDNSLGWAELLKAITQQASKLWVIQSMLLISINAWVPIKLCSFNQGRRQTNMEVNYQNSSLKSCLETRRKILTSGTVTMPSPLAKNTNGIQSTTNHAKHPAKIWNNSALTYLLAHSVTRQKLSTDSVWKKVWQPHPSRKRLEVFSNVSFHSTDSTRVPTPLLASRTTTARDLLLSSLLHMWPWSLSLPQQGCNNRCYSYGLRSALKREKLSNITVREENYCKEQILLSPSLSVCIRHSAQQS